MNGTDDYNCSGVTEDELEIYQEVSYWVNYVMQITVCAIGVFGNCLSIPVLCSKQMNSVFNRLLVFLAIFDNVHLVLTIVESCRQHDNRAHTMAYAYILFPIQSINLSCSIYMTTVLAMERYLAVSKPVEYHNAVNGGRQWTRIVRYVVPVIAFSVAFNIPKFFELQIVEKPDTVPGYEVSSIHIYFIEVTMWHEVCKI